MDWMGWLANGRLFTGWCPFCLAKITLHGLEHKCPQCKHELTQLLTDNTMITVSNHEQQQFPIQAEEGTADSGEEVRSQSH